MAFYRWRCPAVERGTRRQDSAGMEIGDLSTCEAICIFKVHERRLGFFHKKCDVLKVKEILKKPQTPDF